MVEWMPEWIQCIAQVLTLIVLIWAARTGWKQLKIIQEQNKTIQEQNDLSRLVQWKSSLQNVNDSILEHPSYFSKVLYPPPASIDDMKLSIAAYTILNSLESVYYMRKSRDED